MFVSRSSIFSLTFASVMLISVTPPHAIEIQRDEQRIAANEPVMGNQAYVLSMSEIEGLENAAIDGDGVAAFRLSRYYLMIRLEPQQAIKWMRIAAENNYPPAYYNLAFLMRNDPDAASRRRTRYWLQRAVREAPEASALLAASLLKELDASR